MLALTIPAPCAAGSQRAVALTLAPLMFTLHLRARWDHSDRLRCEQAAMMPRYVDQVRAPSQPECRIDEWPKTLSRAPPVNPTARPPPNRSLPAPRAEPAAGIGRTTC